MYHQLSKVTGRLVAATNLQNPLYPIAVNAVQRVEVPIQYNTAHLSTVTEACAAGSKLRMIPGTNIPFGPLPESIRKQQDQFQKDNDTPVFLKGGPFDAILYRLTMFLCIVGIIGAGEVVYSHAVKK